MDRPSSYDYDSLFYKDNQVEIYNPHIINVKNPNTEPWKSHSYSNDYSAAWYYNNNPNDFGQIQNKLPQGDEIFRYPIKGEVSIDNKQITEDLFEISKAIGEGIQPNKYPTYIWREKLTNILPYIQDDLMKYKILKYDLNKPELAKEFVQRMKVNYHLDYYPYVFSTGQNQFNSKFVPPRGQTILNYSPRPKLYETINDAYESFAQEYRPNLSFKNFKIEVQYPLDDNNIFLNTMNNLHKLFNNQNLIIDGIVGVSNSISKYSPYLYKVPGIKPLVIAASVISAIAESNENSEKIEKVASGLIVTGKGISDVIKSQDKDQLTTTNQRNYQFVKGVQQITRGIIETKSSLRTQFDNPFYINGGRRYQQSFNKYGSNSRNWQFKNKNSQSWKKYSYISTSNYSTYSYNSNKSKWSYQSNHQKLYYGLPYELYKEKRIIYQDYQAFKFLKKQGIRKDNFHNFISEGVRYKNTFKPYRKSYYYY